jgi:hypothetical protein
MKKFRDVVTGEVLSEEDAEMFDGIDEEHIKSIGYEVIHTDDVDEDDG